jgi:hypothetical protein
MQKENLPKKHSIKEPMPFTTVVQKLNQGTIPQWGCYPLRVPFFVADPDE